MSDRSRKPRDVNEMAAAIVERATSDEPASDPNEDKNPATVTLGRLGGKRGGTARAEKLTPEQRAEIARKAARLGGGDGREIKAVAQQPARQTPHSSQHWARQTEKSLDQTLRGATRTPIDSQ